MATTQQIVKALVEEQDQRMADLMRTDPVLNLSNMCQVLGGLVQDSDPKVRATGVRLWSQLSGQLAPQQVEVDQSLKAEDVSKLEQALQQMSSTDLMMLFEASVAPVASDSAGEDPA